MGRDKTDNPTCQCSRDEAQRPTGLPLVEIEVDR